ncbi:MAG: hypothetical protein QNI91_08290 [Arenicellales bacterium]|nr:hypothetical protein [Arenicellales bacterium]
MATIERKAYVNGEIVPESRAVISIHDRGFVYGDAVFDTLRTFDGSVGASLYARPSVKAVENIVFSGV